PFITFYDTDYFNYRSRIETAAGEFGFTTESYLNGSNPFAFMTLRNSGNVGIGVMSPAAKLDVSGDWNGNDGALSLSGNLPTLKLAGGYGSFPSLHNSDWLEQVDTSGGLTFWNRNWIINTPPPGFTPYVKLTRDGKVGIGATDPQATLDVRGNTMTQCLTITG